MKHRFCQCFWLFKKKTIANTLHKTVKTSKDCPIKRQFAVFDNRDNQTNENILSV